MFQNYLKLAWRHLVNQKMYSFVKIGGFAIGIAACLLIALFIKDELRYDEDIPFQNRTYRLVTVEKYQGEIIPYTYQQAAVAKVIKEDYPEVEKAGRFLSSELFGAGPNQIRRSDKLQNVYEECFVYMDQDLIDIWGLKMLEGDQEHALDEPNTMVITKSKADKFFPGESAIGKIMFINDDVKKPRKITGVIADFPKNFHVGFDFLMTMAGVVFYEGEQTNWLATNYQTYLRLKEGTDQHKFESKLSAITKKYYMPQLIASGQKINAGQIEADKKYQLQPVSEIYLRNGKILDGLNHGDMRFIWLFGGIAGFILLLACINFVNLSTAKSANRAMEVGLRKTVGSDGNGLISQFLTESLVISFVSISLGFVLAYILLPFFNTLSSKSLVFPFTEWWPLPVLILSSFAIGILAGLYPAFYLSGFKPINVLKGQLVKGKKGADLRSILVVFQIRTFFPFYQLSF